VKKSFIQVDCDGPLDPDANAADLQELLVPLVGR
jgi:hypothetical protein